MSRITVEVQIDADLPRDRLTTDELAELRQLLAQREQALVRARDTQQRIQFLLLVARDRRGLTGSVQADPDTGTLEGTHGNNS